MIYFNLDTLESCIKFLCDFTGLPHENIREFIEHSTTNEENDFFTTFDINLDAIELDNIQVSGVHITTNTDECQSIKKYGLLNLQQALTAATPLRSFFESMGVRFDLENKDIICYKNNKIEQIEELFKDSLVPRKLFSTSHYPINAFLSIKDFKSYAGNVHRRPEFLRDFCYDVGKEAIDYLKEWETSCNPYAIKFNIDFHSCDVTSFLNSYKDFRNDVKNNFIKIKKALIEICLNAAIRHHESDSQSEVFLYLKPQAIVPFDDIYEIIDINTGNTLYKKA